MRHVAGTPVCLLGWRDVTQWCGFWNSWSGSGSRRPHPNSHFLLPAPQPQACLMVSAMWVCSQVPADGGPAGTEDHGTQPLQVLSVPRLQRKLKEAARKILRLRLEKEQLLELGNRLRAELGHLTGGSFPPTPPLLWGWMCRVQRRAGPRRAGRSGEAQPSLGLGTEGRTDRTQLDLCRGSPVNPPLWQLFVRKMPQVSEAAGISMRLCSGSKGCRVPRPATALASSG